MVSEKPEFFNRFFPCIYGCSKLLDIVPDMNTPVTCPATEEYQGVVSGCPYSTSVWYTIQHLNDQHQWTREKIADWIDDLQDNHGLNFTIESPNMDRS